MKGSARAAGLVGAAAGAALVAVALPLELAARDLPLRGGLMQLQSTSVVLWIVETLPLLLGASMYALTSRQLRVVERTAPTLQAPSIPPEEEPSVPAIPAVGAPALGSPRPRSSSSEPDFGGAGVASATLPPPPPLPANLTTAHVLGVQASGPRVHAVQELVRTLREQAETAQRESRGKSRLVSRMAAELRGPLAAIVGRAELLEDEGHDLGPERQQQVREVVRSSRELAALVGDLLDLSKVEVGSLSWVVQDVDLAQVMEEVVLHGLRLTEDARSRFAARIAPDARFVRGDHGRIRQVVLGVASNAFRAKGGTVGVDARADGAWATLAVQVAGTALQAGDLDESVDGDPQGGLGMILARRLTELMGGRFTVGATPDGMTFTVHLPRALGREQPVVVNTFTPDERLAGRHVLVVDADPGGVALMRHLERAGMFVHLVRDLRLASLAADTEDTGLALVDLGLPGAFGLVEDLVAADVKVLATSIRDEDIEEALQLGVKAFLLRPLERGLVVATLGRCLD